MPYPDPSKIQTPLARVRGKGSAKSGVHHWWMVKVTSVALVPLCLWFFFGVLCIVYQGGTYAVTVDWLQKPYNAFLMCLFLGVNFYHAALGGQEVIIDYVHKHKIQLPAVMLYHMICFGTGLLGIFTTLYIAFKL